MHVSIVILYINIQNREKFIEFQKFYDLVNSKIIFC